MSDLLSEVAPYGLKDLHIYLHSLVVNDFPDIWLSVRNQTYLVKLISILLTLFVADKTDAFRAQVAQNNHIEVSKNDPQFTFKRTAGRFSTGKDIHSVNL